MGNEVVLVEVEVEAEVVSIILAALSRHTCYRSCSLSPPTVLLYPLLSLSVPFLLALSCVAVRNRHVVFASTGCLV